MAGEEILSVQSDLSPAGLQDIKMQLEDYLENVKPEMRLARNCMPYSKREFQEYYGKGKWSQKSKRQWSYDTLSDLWNEAPVVSKMKVVLISSEGKLMVE